MGKRRKTRIEKVVDDCYYSVKIIPIDLRSNLSFLTYFLTYYIVECTFIVLLKTPNKTGNAPEKLKPLRNPLNARSHRSP